MNLDISENDIKLILSTLERDISFLEKMGLMDYSLLLGIEKVSHFEDVDISAPRFDTAAGKKSSKGSKDSLTVQRASSVNLSK